MPPRTLLLLLLAVAVLGCEREPRAPVNRELSVFAASSLTEAFSELAGAFERSHPGVDVRLTFAGSQVLRLQLAHGAAADIFASADELHMKALADVGIVANSWTFTHNELVVIVPRDNPAEIGSFADLPRARRLIVGTDNVPVGSYARQVLGRAATVLGEAFTAKVRSRIVSEESNARLVRAKVEMGEAHAALVYRTDAVHSRGLRVIEIPAGLNVRAAYPIGRVTGSRSPALARRFIELVRSDAGKATLARHGFVTGTP